jgi:predicted  nucleic acid-binding Zn-ribbon protein
MEEIQLNLTKQLQKLTENQKLAEEHQQKLAKRTEDLRNQLDQLTKKQENLSELQDRLTLRFQRLVNCLDNSDQVTKRISTGNGGLNSRYRYIQKRTRLWINIALGVGAFTTIIYELCL